jgi:hypothetical protein
METKKEIKEILKELNLTEADMDKYYEDHFEEVMIEKIKNADELTERELSRLAYEYEIEREEGEDRRWSRTITSYVQLKDRFFIVNWEQGLTEMQDNEFYDQPYEVKKKTYEKVIPEHKVTVTEWVRK